MNKILNHYTILSLIYGLVLTVFAYQISYAYFTDSSTSNNNTFTAAAQFPSVVPSGVLDEDVVSTAGDVVINEIYWAGSNNNVNDEWIELKNNTSNPINLNGWVIENLGTTVPASANITINSASAVIPANGFFLITAIDKTLSKVNVDPDYSSSGIALGNGGEQLVLRTNTNLLMDTANGTGPWFAGDNTAPKKSMERKTPAGDGTVTGNWQSAATHTNMDSNLTSDEFGTPKAENGL